MNKLLGNEEIRRELERGGFSHAYLIAGAAGMGKKTLAKLFAAKLVEDTVGLVERNSHPDVLWLAPKEEGKQIPVDEVRAFRREAYTLPNQAPKKVMIIDHCESLNDNGQNAILKILEEPPAHVVFLLLAPEREAVLPTIRSRCVIWEMQPVGEREGVAFLKERFPEEERAATLLKAAGGNLGLAMAYLEGGTLLTYGDLGVRLLGKLCRNKMLEADRMIATLPKGEFLSFLDSFSRLCHDFLLYKTGGGEENIVFLESILQIKGFLGRMKLEQLYGMADLALKSKRLLRDYCNENLVKACFVAEMGELLR
ncbi:MAG: DNA polymerase III subunit [Clostridia bacterium]|nr:DNA polymerase III subunit [Clostridia bacterium]